jgi:hypothetical protein
MSTAAGQWRRCNACKGPIPFGATYWVCNVSTCNRPRTGLVFCSVSCWEVHLPEARHRESWALERKAPATAEGASPGPAAAAGPRPSHGPASDTGGEARAGVRRLVRGPSGREQAPPAPQDILVIASRLKDYVRARSGFHTSDGVLEPLSDIVRRLCDEAIRNASREGRKTVLERDVPKP